MLQLNVGPPQSRACCQLEPFAGARVKNLYSDEPQAVAVAVHTTLTPTMRGDGGFAASVTASHATGGVSVYETCAQDSRVALDPI